MRLREGRCAGSDSASDACPRSVPASPARSASLATLAVGCATSGRGSGHGHDAESLSGRVRVVIGCSPQTELGMTEKERRECPTIR